MDDKYSTCKVGMVHVGFQWLVLSVLQGTQWTFLCVRGILTANLDMALQ